MNKDFIIQLMSNGYTTYDVIVNYQISEDLILECVDILDKNPIIQGYNLSEGLINKLIDSEYFITDDIYEFNMTTYSNLSDQFIIKYKENINWDRMMLYISTQSDSFENHADIIESRNLWKFISANDLSIEFIRQWKDKLDWSYLSMVKNFTDEEKEEFSDYIITPVQPELNDDPFVNSDDLKFTDKMSDEDLEELILEISKHIGK
jgi:hypothetical protein